MAVFVDAALSTKTTKLKLPLKFLQEFETNTIQSKEQPQPVPSSSLSPPLQVILVGTEAARGLPQMGIPVPDFEGAKKSLIRNKLLLLPLLRDDLDAPNNEQHKNKDKD